MIAGTVTANREAIVQLTVQSPVGVSADLEFVVDTGFTEQVTLPFSWVQSLALPHVDTAQMDLADGTAIQVDVYEATVTWDGRNRPVLVHCIEGAPLIGMLLLYDHLLNAHVVNGGPITITAVP